MKIKSFKKQSGIAAVEYALMLVLIAVVLTVGMSALGDNLCGVFNGIANLMDGAEEYSFAACP